MHILTREESVDKAGCRAGFLCEDHLFVVAIIAESSLEWNLPVWMAAVDFPKTFDSVLYECIWRGLKDQRVPDAYIGLLQRLYDEQESYVLIATVENFRRGTKQGDPICRARVKANEETKGEMVLQGVGSLIWHLEFEVRG